LFALTLLAVSIAGCTETKAPGPAQAGPPLKIAYVDDSVDGAWVEALGESLAADLGITVDAVGYPSEQAIREALDAGESMAVLSSRRAQTPSVSDYLESLFVTGAPANLSGYSSPEFEDLLNQAYAAETDDDAVGFRYLAQQRLMEDLPAIPLWTLGAAAIWLPSTQTVAFNWKGVVDYPIVGTTAENGTVTAYAVEPASSLLPSDAMDDATLKIVDQLYSRLVKYDVVGDWNPDMAEVVDTEDGVTITVALRTDLFFSDGSPVTSDSFIDAWDDAALKSSGHAGAWMFQRIKGFSATEDSHIKGEGLKKIDDITFTVELGEPQPEFMATLGHSVFAPLPASAFDENGKVTAEYQQHPIGNGPYLLDEYKPGEYATLSPNSTYHDFRNLPTSTLKFVFYNDAESAYQDLNAGKLDLLDKIPADAWATLLKSPPADTLGSNMAPITYFLTIPTNLDHFTGEEGALRRAALSRAIDRASIAVKVFDSLALVPTDFTASSLKGWAPTIPGQEVLEHNPDEAHRLWAEANDITPWN